MLDAPTYRTSEQLAKAQMATWRISQTHNVDHFERVGFPVRINSYRDLGQLLDTMQENRFAKYMNELGGLSDAEYELLIDVCCDLIDFQSIYFPNRRAILPISTLLSSFTLFKKMKGINPDFRSVLEVGPGCGYLSLFMRRHAPLENYSQIEACESFYILQSLVNSFCYGPRFEERAYLPASSSVIDHFAMIDSNTEISPLVDVDRSRPLCTHIPWWRIGELVSREAKFDIVTSNANLLEFNASALEDYLTLLHGVMKPGGYFLVHCTGYPASGTLEYLIDKIWNKGFATVMFVLESTPTSPPSTGAGTSLLAQLRSPSSVPVTFTVNNALFVRTGHDLFPKYHRRENCHTRFVGNESVVNDAFFVRPPERKTYSMSQILEDTEKALRSRNGRRSAWLPPPFVQESAGDAATPLPSTTDA